MFRLFLANHGPAQIRPEGLAREAKRTAKPWRDLRWITAGMLEARAPNPLHAGGEAEVGRPSAELDGYEIQAGDAPRAPLSHAAPRPRRSRRQSQRGNGVGYRSRHHTRGTPSAFSPGRPASGNDAALYQADARRSVTTASFRSAA